MHKYSEIHKYSPLSMYNATCMYIFRVDHFCGLANQCVLPWGKIIYPL